MLNKLLLQTGEDVPFLTAGVTIHTPKLKEIGLIGERDFLIGCHFLNFSKDKLSDEDKSNLENKSDFEIFMSVMNSREKAIHKTNGIMVLALLFPQYEIKITKDKILLQSEKNSSSINEQNFDDFKEILNQLFCLTGEAEDAYNPADALAARIAEKIKKGKQKRNKQEIEDNENLIRRIARIVIISDAILKVNFGDFVY